MKKKLIIISIVNLFFTSILLHLNQVRFTRTSFFKEFQTVLASDSYEELVRDKEFSIVQFDDIIMTIEFDQTLFMISLRENPFWSPFSKDISSQIFLDYPVYGKPLVEFATLDTSLSFDYKLFKRGALLYTEDKDITLAIEPSEGPYAYNIKRQEVKPNLYYYPNTTKDGKNTISYNFYSNLVRAVKDDKPIFNEYYPETEATNINFKGKHFDQMTFPNPILKLATPDDKQYYLAENDEHELIFSYDVESYPNSDWDIEPINTTISVIKIKDKPVYYWTDQNIDEGADQVPLYYIDTLTFEVMYPELERVFD